MIFNEIYSAYYNAVAKILTKASEPHITEKELQNQVIENAFSESVLTILPNLKSAKWPLLRGDLSSVLKHTPTIPLTTLQKRWLKSLLDDPRVKLFDVSFPNLDGIKPLFTREDYKIFDQYANGDPYEDESYIKNFRLILSAIKEHRPVKINMINRHEREVNIRFYPKGLEYSLKDDKFRIIADGCKFKYYNMGRIKKCEYYTGNGPRHETPQNDTIKELTLAILNERNALERAMLHFAHFEKQAEKIDETHYSLRLKYYASDETELVIRILSFGPFIKVKEPESFVNLIKERLILQKSCELK